MTNWQLYSHSIILNKQKLTEIQFTINGNKTQLIPYNVYSKVYIFACFIAETKNIYIKSCETRQKKKILFLNNRLKCEKREAIKIDDNKIMMMLYDKEVCVWHIVYSIALILIQCDGCKLNGRIERGMNKNIDFFKVSYSLQILQKIHNRSFVSLFAYKWTTTVNSSS